MKYSSPISPTANILFHDTRFGIDKAFYIVFMMIYSAKSVSVEKLSRILSINRKSALTFQHTKSIGQNPLTGPVEVAFIGKEGYMEEERKIRWKLLSQL